MTSADAFGPGLAQGKYPYRVWKRAVFHAQTQEFVMGVGERQRRSIGILRPGFPREPVDELDLADDPGVGVGLTDRQFLGLETCGDCAAVMTWSRVRATYLDRFRKAAEHFLPRCECVRKLHLLPMKTTTA